MTDEDDVAPSTADCLAHYVDVVLDARKRQVGSRRCDAHSREFGLHKMPAPSIVASAMDEYNVGRRIGSVLYEGFEILVRHNP